jgi:copper chaperone CopZ
MTHTYTLTGMTCGSCESKVKRLLLGMANVTAVEVSKSENAAVITMDGPIQLRELQAALGGSESKYQITNNNNTEASVEQINVWWVTYKPILLVFAYITGITLLIQMSRSSFDSMEWMRHFMAGFFLVFSFFKLLNVSAFADSYAMYDIVAKRFKGWGYIYACLELLLGIAYLIDFNPLLVNVVTAVVMTISIIGVLQSVMNKQKIKCACLGSVFNLPMSTITIIEDGLMIGMSVYMILKLI